MLALTRPKILIRQCKRGGGGGEEGAGQGGLGGGGLSRGAERVLLGWAGPKGNEVFIHPAPTHDGAREAEEMSSPDSFAVCCTSSPFLCLPSSVFVRYVSAFVSFCLPLTCSHPRSHSKTRNIGTDKNLQSQIRQQAHQFLASPLIYKRTFFKQIYIRRF